MAHAKLLRILFVEDLPTDTELAEKEIRKGGFEFNSQRVDTKGALLKALEEFQPDVVVSDYAMPEFDGMQALKLSLERDSTLPFIILTGSMNEETAVECLKAGATNYVIKEHIARLPFAIQDALQQKKERIARDKAERALRESNTFNTTLLQAIPFGMDIVDESGNTLFLNPAMEKAVGQYALGARCWDLYKDDKQQCAGCPLKQNIEVGAVEILESSGVLGGKIFEISHIGIIFQGKKAMLEIFHDITERKHMYEILGESEEKFRTILHTAMDGFWLADNQGQLLEVNEAYCRMSGYNKQELLTMNISDLESAESSDATAAHIRNVIAKGEDRFESKHARKDGSVFDLEISVQFRDIQGGRFVAFLQDITERNRLTAVSKLQSFSIEKQADAMFWLKADGGILDVNPAACVLLGYTREELRGKLVADVDNQWDAETWAKQFAELRQRGSLKFEFEQRHRDGRLTPVEVVANYLKFGDLELNVSTVRDVSKRKQVELELLSAKNHLQATLDASPDLMFEVGLDGRYYDYHSSNKAGLAVPPEIFLGKLVSEILPPDSAAIVMAALQEANENGQSRGKEIILTLPEGQKLFELSVARKSSLAGEGPRFIVISRDITERKRTEREISMLASALKSIKECVSVTDLEDIILFVNRSFVETYGYSESELIGQNIDMVRSPNNPRDLVQDILPATLKGGWIGEALNRRKDGSEFPIYLSTTSILGENGQAIALIGVASDITERKRAELDLMKLHKAIDSSEESIFLTDREGIFTMINQGFTRMYGYTAAEVVGKTTPRILKGGRMNPEDYEIFWHTLLNKQVVKGELINKTKEGRLVTVDFSSNPILDDSQGIIGFLGIQRDVTEHKKAEEQQKQLQLQLNQAQKMESIGTLAGGIAHDFNNILGIIMAYSSLLQHGKLGTKELPDTVGTILKATERGAALVNQILTFARKSDVSVGAVQVNYIIKELISMLDQTFPRTIIFAVDLEKSLPVISIDPNQFNQVLMNLCVNARDAIVEANQKGRTESKISIRTSTISGKDLQQRFTSASPGDYISISVSDTGSGMDENAKHRVFEPFFTTKEQGKGTGLGLAVVYGIVQSHQGIIDLESELEKGTTFTMYFPVPHGASVERKSDKKKLLETSGGNETILVVEDEEALRVLLMNLLQAKGYTVMTASDGLEAVEMFEKNKSRISLVVSDHGLPRMNGADAVKRMIAAKPAVKCILASGFMESNQKSEMLKSGVKEFIQKPYDPMEVVRKVREVLDLK